MRKLLLLALLLYNVVVNSVRIPYDYEESDHKRGQYIDERKNWRKKALPKMELDPKMWDDRRRYEHEARYIDEDNQGYGIPMDRNRESDLPSPYRSQRRYEDIGLGSLTKSTEVGRSSMFMEREKEIEKKSIGIGMNCDRPHERYESCFAGCAAISCDNPRERLRPCFPFCEPGCICVHPYVRDDRTHKCVLPDECSKGLKGIPDINEEL